MKYLLLAKDNVDRAWPSLAPWIAQAVYGTKLSEQLDVIRANAKAGGAQIWVGGLFPDIEMVLVTEGMEIDGVPTLVLRIYAGANVDLNMEQLPVVQKWALDNGFREMQVWGRLGWLKKLRHLGYEPDYLVLTKNLKQELH